MDIFEIHKYDRMPLPAPVPPETLAFEVLFKRPAPPRREPSALVSYWRTWLTSAN